jgi:hypothetical protein
MPKHAPQNRIAKPLKLDLIERMLGLRHKLKVHDSMNVPDTHEELASSLNTRWEIEDEIRAIEEILAEDRADMIAERREELLDGIIKKKKET